MNFMPLESSHLKSAGHDRVSSILTINFHDGSAYGYQAVPEGVYQRLISAKSAGEFFNTSIKGQYKSARLSPPTPKKQPT